MRWFSSLLLDVERLKGFQLQGGFAPLTPWPGALPLDPAASVLLTLNLKIGTGKPCVFRSMFCKLDVRRKSIVTLALSYRKVAVRYLVNRAPGETGEGGPETRVPVWYELCRALFIGRCCVTWHLWSPPCPRPLYCHSVWQFCCQPWTVLDLLASPAMGHWGTCPPRLTTIYFFRFTLELSPVGLQSITTISRVKYLQYFAYHSY